MGCNLLLYGATGFSGRLIAAEGKDKGLSCNERRSGDQMILAARDGAALRRVAHRNDMDFRVFALDDPGVIRRHLDDIDVLINAAGPFAFTAAPLARAALEAGCHYVDINGEIDVYRRLDDLALKAARRGIAIVSGAGASAAASDLLLDRALREALHHDPSVKRDGLGAIRIAMLPVTDFSRGSAATAARMLREQVVVVRAAPPSDGMVICHEPVGRLERMFDFGGAAEDEADRPAESDHRIAPAANLIDTLTAKHTADRLGITVRAIEAYVPMDAVGRFAYQAGSMLSSLSALPGVRALTAAQLSLLPEGPTHRELDRGSHVIVLEIEDAYRTRIIDWRWKTPNVYRLTALLVVAIAKAVARRRGAERMGWVTPADAFGATEFERLVLRDYPWERRERRRD